MTLRRDGSAPRARLLPLAVAVAVAGCAPPAPSPPQAFAFHVSSDPDVPLAGAQLRMRGNLLATSDAGGVARFAVNGRDGEPFDVAVECPTGYRSPTLPTTVTLGRLVAADEVTEFDVRCTPAVRTVVVAVNGSKGRRLPVLLLGREIARTDASGVATVLLHPEPQEQLELTLDTSDKDSADLRPRSPTATFVAKNEDDVFLFDPHFSVAARKAPPPAPRVVHAPLKPVGPVRIQ
jgi:hypothetical protein